MLQLMVPTWCREISIFPSELSQQPSMLTVHFSSLSLGLARQPLHGRPQLSQFRAL
jgi:hypothetical protein